MVPWQWTKQSIGQSHIHILLLFSIWFIPYDSIRLGSQKIPSWVVVWSHWCRPRKPQLFFYMVLTGLQNMQETNLISTFYAQVTLESHTALFFSSCLEWRYVLPLLEESGIETWAIDILGWGFSDLGLFYYFSYCMLLLSALFMRFLTCFLLFFFFYSSEKLPPCDVVSKRDHFYQVLMY